MEERIELHDIQAIYHKSNGGLGALETIFPYYGEQVFEPENTQATLQDAQALQFSSFGESVGESVSIDVTSSYSGTPFPTSTLQQP